MRFFFSSRRRHTRYWRDWSSDVCSSDLAITRRLVEEFVRRPPPGSGPPAELSQLTERELEVLKLIARGLSNAEIAAELYLSEATVKTHITHVLTKLNLRDRVQAVVLAYE